MSSANNPLRPYYIPPSPTSLPPPPAPTSSPPIPVPREASLPSWATDNDYEFHDSGSLIEALQATAQVGLFKYSQHLIQHPFDVATILLRVRVASAQDRRRFRFQEDAEGGAEFEIEDDEFLDSKSGSEEDDDDEPAYFADQKTINPDRGSRRKRSERKLVDRGGYVVNNALKADDELPSHQIRIRDPDSTRGCLKAVWEKEGLWGVWKGNNCGFIYSVLFNTLQPLTQSFLGTVFSLPDLETVSILDCESPVMCLTAMAASFAITSIALAPIDITRTKLIISPLSAKQRGLWPTLKSLPTGYTCPQNLLLPTCLYAIMEPVFDYGTLIFLKRKLNIDPETSGISASVFSTFASVLRTFVEIPVETVLRRGQVEAAKPDQTVVTTGKYSGFFGTMWMIVKEEQAAGGNGHEGLFRGWRLEMWGKAFEFISGLFSVQNVGEEF